MPPAESQAAELTPRTQAGPEAAEDECLSRIQPEGSQDPLFIVHGIHGEVLFAHFLKAGLGSQRPLFAFRAMGLNGRRPPLSSIGDMAARLLRSMRRVRPRGPYLLAGYCAGGHIAMEMGHRLRKMGEEVAHLFLIDTYAEAKPWEIDTVTAQAVQSARRAVKRSQWFQEHRAGSPATIAAFGEALKAHSPRPYAGRVHIIASEGEIRRTGQVDLGWSRFLTPATPVEILRNAHQDMARQEFAAIAEFVRSRLEGF